MKKQSALGEISFTEHFPNCIHRWSWTVPTRTQYIVQELSEASVDERRWTLLSPTDVPIELLACWRAIEFGQYADAAQTLGDSKTRAIRK
ncbi:MAG: hypothetical protein R3C56_40425 [Pirellulaceae bacterium]